jgi:phosphatidylserine/phosphatidylglycerophosphate/cardiolipin synthase-like enzyme
VTSAPIVSLSTTELREILRGLRSGEIVSPVTEERLAMLGLAPLWSALQPYADLPSSALELVLQTLVDARVRPREDIEVVWTSDSGSQATVRNTQIAMQQMLEEAKQHLLIAGYRFTKAKQMFAGIRQKFMSKGLKCQFIVDVPSRGKNSVEQHLKFQRNIFLQDVWHDGIPPPEVYFDPRCLQQRAVSSMHAKCAVADFSTSYVGSANFTSRGYHRNMELGLLVRNTVIAKTIVSHWQHLINDKKLHPLFP